MAASTACIGLLRWDAGTFRIQPLAVETTARKKTVALHAGAWAGGAADKAGEPPEAFRESFARELQETIPRLLGPSAERSGVAAADFIRDPRTAEILLAPRKSDQTLLDLIRAAQLGPVGLAQVVDLTVLYKR